MEAESMSLTSISIHVCWFDYPFLSQSIGEFRFRFSALTNSISSVRYLTTYNRLKRLEFHLIALAWDKMLWKCCSAFQGKQVENTFSVSAQVVRSLSPSFPLMLDVVFKELLHTYIHNCSIAAFILTSIHLRCSLQLHLISIERSLLLCLIFLVSNYETSWVRPQNKRRASAL